jgi:hypothetical protein
MRCFSDVRAGESLEAAGGIRLSAVVTVSA